MNPQKIRAFHNQLFEGVQTEELEDYLKFKENKLFQVLFNYFETTKANVKNAVISPKRMMQENEKGNTIETFQGIYSGACLFKDLFDRMQEEYDLRINELNRAATERPVGNTK